MIVRQEDSHPTSEDTLQVEKAVSNMRKRAREETTSVPRIYDQTLQVMVTVCMFICKLS